MTDASLITFLTEPSSIELIVHTHEVVILIYAFNLETKQGLKRILQTDRQRGIKTLCGDYRVLRGQQQTMPYGDVLSGIGASKGLTQVAICIDNTQYQYNQDNTIITNTLVYCTSSNSSNNCTAGLIDR